MIISIVPVDYVHQHWHLVEPFITDALSKGTDTEYTLDQLKGMIISGAHKLVVAMDEDKVVGAATVSFINYPNNRVAFVSSIGGRLITNQDTWDQFSTWMKSMGATVCQGAARESVARLWTRYGFTERHRIVERLL